MRLTIVIVSWNVRHHLADCLRSLHASGANRWATVVVVDNASTDESADMIDRDFPWVTLVRSTQNLGFTRANNLAIRSARTPHVLLLNPDTVVPAGALEALVGAMDADSTLGVVGPRLVGLDGAIQFEGAASQPTAWNALCDLAMLSRVFPRSRVFSRRTLGWWDHRDDRDVPGIAGAAMLLRRTALDQVGLLDETMFCVEDMDLCRRMTTAGWRVRYIGTTAITHVGGGSIKQADAGRQRQIAYHSFWIYLRKHDGPFAAAVMAAGVFAVSLAGWSAAGLMRMFLRRSSGVAQSLGRIQHLAAALIAWSLTNKWQFRHPLAERATP